MVDAGLTEDEVCSVKRLAFAGDRFEPFAISIVSQATLDLLVEAGLAEPGRSCRPAVGIVGYRLTDAGWRVARDFWTWTKPTALMFADARVVATRH